MELDIAHYTQCITTLETSLALLDNAAPDSTEYEVYRNAVVKGFELTLETAEKLLRKTLKTYTGNPREVDALPFKDVLRHAAKYGVMDVDAVGRWFSYRNNRNATAHDYGIGFARDTLTLLPAFLGDARVLESVLREKPEREHA